MPPMRSGRMVIGSLAATVALTGCVKNSGTNLVNGKAKFNEQCSACHTLARADAKGTTGPNLDTAFAQARADGLGESTFEGIVHQWILHPNTKVQVDPETGK